MLHPFARWLAVPVAGILQSCSSRSDWPPRTPTRGRAQRIAPATRSRRGHRRAAVRHAGSRDRRETRLWLLVLPFAVTDDATASHLTLAGRGRVSFTPGSTATILLSGVAGDTRHSGRLAYRLTPLRLEVVRRFRVWNLQPKSAGRRASTAAGGRLPSERTGQFVPNARSPASPSPGTM